MRLLEKSRQQRRRALIPWTGVSSAHGTGFNGGEEERGMLGRNRLGSRI